MNQINHRSVNATGGAGGGAGGSGGGGGGGGGSGGTVILNQNESEDKAQANIRLKQLERRISLLEFLLPLTFTILATFIYALIKILDVTFNTAPMFNQGLQFFAVSYLTFNFLLFMVNSMKKAGTKFEALKKDWQDASTLTKTLVALGLPSIIISTVQFVRWIVEFIISAELIK